VSALANAYRTALPAGSPHDDESPALEATLAALCARGRTAHPDVAIDELTFAGHLARCAAPLLDKGAAIHAEDVYLACAALNSSMTAIQHLRRNHRQTIVGYLRVVEATSVAFEEIEQQVWSTLLVGQGDNRPRLSSYSGKGPLAGFVGIVAQRIAIDGHRRRAVERRAAAGMAAEVNAWSSDAELGFVKQRYREGFKVALQDALATLDNRERLILRMHVVDGLSFDRIAKVYGVSQSTVSRWVAAARDAVRANASHLLRERLALSESEFDSLAGLVLSQLDVSVSCLMRQSNPVSASK
jgi:RNA polymerase sigma-70 factor (ECF subfamily)